MCMGGGHSFSCLHPHTWDPTGLKQRRRGVIMGAYRNQIGIQEGSYKVGKAVTLQAYTGEPVRKGGIKHALYRFLWAITSQS